MTAKMLRPTSFDVAERAGVSQSTVSRALRGSPGDNAETRAFLERRIEGVMKFEAAKARLLKDREIPFSPARFLGRLRYPGR